MPEIHPIMKKLQWKDHGQPVLIMNAPQAYTEILQAFEGDVHSEPEQASYEFVQVFGAMNEELQASARHAVKVLAEDGLLWLCYPKKTSKVYKGSDCIRESVAGLLAVEGFEPVRQIAIDDDWSALRFRKPENIKTMVRSFAVTEKGKQRTESGQK